jgi:integrase
MRALTPSEIGTLWKAAGSLVPLERDLLRLLLAVPLRKGEVSALDWAWIDRTSGMITLPGKLMKNGEAHAIPLGEMARRVLSDVTGGDWPARGRVFVSSNARTLEWSRFKSRIDKAAPAVTGWVFHDTRRTFVSVLAERGHDEAVIDAMLAHRASATRSGVLGVYQTSRRLPEQRAAMADWDRVIAGAIGEGTDNVVPMRA